MRKKVFYVFMVLCFLRFFKKHEPEPFVLKEISWTTFMSKMDKHCLNRGVTLGTYKFKRPENKDEQKDTQVMLAKLVNTHGKKIKSVSATLILTKLSDNSTCEFDVFWISHDPYKEPERSIDIRVPIPQTCYEKEGFKGEDYHIQWKSEFVVFLSGEMKDYRTFRDRVRVIFLDR